MVTCPSYPTVISLIFLVFLPVHVSGSCGGKTLSCPVENTFLKEVEAFSNSSLEKVDNLFQTKEFKDFLAEIKTSPKKLQQADISSTLYIFVSFSLGDKAILNLMEEAKIYGATLVLRGFKESSLRKTVAALHKIILKTGQGVLIDPELFTVFDVTAVPTFILAKSSLHDRLQGHVSLKYALETFAKEGDLKNEAKTLLTQGRIP